MEQGFGYGDIIVFAAIAAFILLRYRGMLGEKMGRDAPPKNAAPLAEYERVIQLPATQIAASLPKKEESMEKYGALAETFVAMRGIDREFTPEEFLGGARTAYEMVHTAYNKADRETLKMLLSDGIYKEFDQSLNNAHSMGRITETTLVAISKAEISSATLKGNLATLTVDFVSTQIQLTRDSSGTVLEGNASQEEQVEDTWVFTRSMNSTSPNWTIIET